MNPPTNYPLLRQLPSRPCEVVHVQSGRETVLFSGKRWAARRYLRTLRSGIGWEGLAAYNLKESGRLVQMADGL